MSLYRAPKRPNKGVRRGADVRHAHAHHSSHVLRNTGQAELVQKAVEYRVDPQLPRKRPRPRSPTPDTMDTDWIDVPMRDASTSFSTPGLLHATDTLTPLLDEPVSDSASSHLDSLQHTKVDSMQTETSSKTGDHKVPKVRRPKFHTLYDVDSTTEPVVQSRTVASQINQWLPYETTILQRLLSRESAMDIGEVCSCRRASAVRLYRCLECGDAPSRCEVCIEQHHLHLHFHWIQRWNGQFFEPIDLAYLKHVIYLGHNDLPCHKIPTKTPPSNMVVVHTNSVHRCLIHKCYCAQKDGEMYAQLISGGLWPASITRPETAFTESLMKEWHLVWDISHQSAQDFFRVKARIGNNARPEQVDVRSFIYLYALRLFTSCIPGPISGAPRRWTTVETLCHGQTVWTAPRRCCPAP